MARGNLYGPYSRQTTRAGNAIQHYDPEIMLDLEISAPLGDGYTVAIGARNLFDNYPATNKIDDTNGRTFVDGPVDWQGGSYFGRLAYSFWCPVERSDARRVGNECVRTCWSRGSPYQ